ncbi:MAG: Rieske 2Fe-2S domain-containing protein [Planctomycetota bacterium]|jgi:nitrite reductase/ring-hydroxylating ferredoxin subunit
MKQRWLNIGRPTELHFSPGAAVRIEDKWLAIFPLDGGFVAIDNACPHAGAPLCDGSVQDGKVACCLHLWEFDLRTGTCDVGVAWNVASYPVRITDGVLQVALP